MKFLWAFAVLSHFLIYFCDARAVIISIENDGLIDNLNDLISVAEEKFHEASEFAIGSLERLEELRDQLETVVNDIIEETKKALKDFKKACQNEAELLLPFINEKVNEFKEMTKKFDGEAEDFIQLQIEKAELAAIEAIATAKMLGEDAELQVKAVLDALKQQFLENEAEGKKIATDALSNAKSLAKDILQKGAEEAETLIAMGKDQIKKLEELIFEIISFNNSQNGYGIKDFFHEQLAKIKSISDKLVLLAKERLEIAKIKVMAALDQVRGKGEVILDDIKAVFEQIKEAAEDEIENITPVVSDVIDEAKEVAKKFKGEAREFIEKVISSTEVSVEDALGRAKAVAIDAQIKGEAILENLVEKAKETSAEGKEIVQEMVAEVKAQIKDIIGKATEEGDRLKTLVKEYLENIINVIKSTRFQS